MATMPQWTIYQFATTRLKVKTLPTRTADQEVLECKKRVLQSTKQIFGILVSLIVQMESHHNQVEIAMAIGTHTGILD